MMIGYVTIILPPLEGIGGGIYSMILQSENSKSVSGLKDPRERGNAGRLHQQINHFLPAV